MSTDLMMRIMGRNQAGPALAEAKRDVMAVGAATQVAGAQAVQMGNQIARASRMAQMQTRNLVFQLNDIGVSLISGMNPLMVMAQQGSQIATIYGPEQGGVGMALKETGRLAVGLVTKFAPIGLAVGAVAGVIAGVTHEINAATGANVSFGDTAVAMWQLFSEGVYNFVKPAFDQVVVWAKQLWDLIQPHLKNLGNGLVGTFVFGYKNAITAWEMLPAAMGDIAISAANGVISAVESMVNGTIGAINWLIDQAREKTNGLVNFGNLGTQEFDRIINPNEGAAAGMIEQIMQNFQDAFGRDYMGEAFAALTERAVALAGANDQVTDSLDRMSGGLQAANDNAEMLGGTMTQTVTGVLGALSGMTSSLERVFQDNKALSVATAVLKGAEAIASAYASGAAVGGPVLGAVYAGAAAISAAANVAAVLSTNRNSTSINRAGNSTSVPSAPSNTSGQQTGPTTVNLQINGNSFGREHLEQLARQLQDLANDGGIRVVAA